uniref:MFS_1_like domain-containing protein n=1 Tax=Heterorhabditis bacteriophora TaxID=37862 RepID=A0A1I7X4K4_HETBA
MAVVPEGNKSCQMMIVEKAKFSIFTHFLYVVPYSNAILRPQSMLYRAPTIYVPTAKRGFASGLRPIYVPPIVPLLSKEVNSSKITKIVLVEDIYEKQPCRICNYNEDKYGVLVSPPHSTRVYRQPAVEQAFMLLLLLIALGEFFSSPALALADAATLQAVKDNPQEFGKIRLFASVGWGLAMFVMGIATQFKFGDDTARPDEVVGLVMDTRESEVSHVVAEKARARQVQADGAAENTLLIAFKALASTHVIIYLGSVTVMGFGAGLVFSFLYWHLQVKHKLIQIRTV